MRRYMCTCAKKPVVDVVQCHKNGHIYAMDVNTHSCVHILYVFIAMLVFVNVKLKILFGNGCPVF